MSSLSGAGALGLETVWFSQAGLVVGNSVWSAALVVAAFMGGLGLGNATAMALARRWKQPLLGYALVEALAAASGAVLAGAFPYLPALFRPPPRARRGRRARPRRGAPGLRFLSHAVPPHGARRDPAARREAAGSAH